MGVKSSTKPSSSFSSDGLSKRSTRFSCRGHTPAHGVQAVTSVSHDLKFRFTVLKYSAFCSAVQFS